jgi:hypothetical protein
MNFGTDEHAWFSTMLDGMGKAKGLEFMKALAKQQLHFPGSSSVMRVQLMLGGESAMVIAARGPAGNRNSRKKAHRSIIGFSIPIPLSRVHWRLCGAPRIRTGRYCSQIG